MAQSTIGGIQPRDKAEAIRLALTSLQLNQGKIIAFIRSGYAMVAEGVASPLFTPDELLAACRDEDKVLVQALQTAAPQLKALLDGFGVKTDDSVKLPA